TTPRKKMPSCEDCRHGRYEPPDRSRIEKHSLTRSITPASPGFRSPAGKCHGISSGDSLRIVWFHPDAYGTIPDAASRRGGPECIETRYRAQLRGHALQPRIQNAESLQEYPTLDELMCGCPPAIRSPMDYLHHPALPQPSCFSLFEKHARWDAPAAGRLRQNPSMRHKEATPRNPGVSRDVRPRRSMIEEILHTRSKSRLSLCPQQWPVVSGTG